MSMLHRQVEVKTSQQHYVGSIVGHLFKSRSYDVKISEVIKGNKKIGQVSRFSTDVCITIL